MGDRRPGPICSSQLGGDWIDHGTMCRARTNPPGTTGSSRAGSETIVSHGTSTAKQDTHAPVLQKTPAEIAQAVERVARKALNGILVTSIEKRWEYGGMICIHPDGSVSAMPPRTQKDPTTVDVGQHEPNCGCPSGSKPVAYYHTHPTYSVAGFRAEYDSFSPDDDIAIAKDFRMDVYLGTLDGSFLKYDYKLNKATRLQPRLRNTTDPAASLSRQPTVSPLR